MATCQERVNIIAKERKNSPLSKVAKELEGVIRR
jgi:hypothetical protein